ncbi:MAG: hypothetical protein EXQ97_06395 [Alphaproteobacteria bacterium]|nr:hypothetical protein [Alphaproteobacteria bacterium]
MPHHAVANMLVDTAAMRLEDTVGPLEEMPEQTLHVLGVDRVAQGGEADDIGEHDGDLSTLAVRHGRGG